MIAKKKRAPRNRTITLTDAELSHYEKKLLYLNKKPQFSDIINRIINQNTFKIFDYLPEKFVDLLFFDPPYKL